MKLIHISNINDTLSKRDKYTYVRTYVHTHTHTHTHTKVERKRERGSVSEIERERTAEHRRNRKYFNSLFSTDSL